MTDSLSVIIPTRNRYKLLKLTICSLLKQTLDKKYYEIIIVDNGSTDKTCNLINKIIKKNIKFHIKYIYDDVPGLLTGRHRGALEAKGKILVFVDDDIIADKGYLKAIYLAFKDRDIQLVGGRNLPLYQEKPPRWLDWFWNTNVFGRWLGELSLLDFGEKVKEIDPNFIFGLNLAIRKKALFELGGFHPDSISKKLQYFQGDGETGLTKKAFEKKFKAIYHPKALIYHQISSQRMTYKYFEERYFYQGVCNSYSKIRENNRFSINMLIKDRILLFTYFIKFKLMYVYNYITTTKDKRDKSLLKLRFYKAYFKGYRYHQKMVKKYPKLLNWIVKDNYWNYKLPVIYNNYGDNK